MDISQVTGGVVAVEDGNPATDQYDPKRKARVELTFAVAENATFEEAQLVLDRVTGMADGQLQDILGRKRKDALGTLGPVVEAEVAPKATRTRKAASAATPPPAGPAAMVDPDASETPAETTPQAGEGPATDPAAVADVIALPDQSDATNPAAMEDWEAPAEAVITDEDLNAATMKKNQEIGDPVRVRTLIQSFFDDATKVFQLRQIPAERRQEYLDKLGALKKA